MTEIRSEKISGKRLKKMEKRRLKKEIKKEIKKIKRKKKNALVVCRSGKEFWTTQDQFWQWVREKTIVKRGDNPLRGDLLRHDDELAVVISNTVLNLAHPNHLSEALYSRRYRVNQ